MFRRCLFLLVIWGLVASNLASIPHAHARMSTEEQHQHDTTPHFHPSWLGHHHGGKDHSHGDHRHQHAAPARPTQPAQPTQQPQSELLSVGIDDGDGHHAMAIFLLPVALICTGERAVSLFPVLNAPAELVACIPIFALIEVRDPIRQGDPPDHGGWSGYLYLKLRNLRI